MPTIRQKLAPRRRLRRFLSLDYDTHLSYYDLIGRMQSAPPPDIQVDADDSELSQLLARTARTWQLLGEERPEWSVMTDFTGDQQRFFESGRGNVDLLLAALRRNGEDQNRIESVLDFGCGVGRVTKYLAEQFPRTLGVDISQPHLQIARKQVPGSEFRLLQSVDDVETLPEVDLVFSVIVLQHNPPPVIAVLLDRLLSKTRQYIYFQVPTYSRSYSYNVQVALDDTLPRFGSGYAPPGVMEMHVLPQRHVHAAFARHGFVLLEAQEDASPGTPEMQSTTFLAKRQSPMR